MFVFIDIIFISSIFLFFPKKLIYLRNLPMMCKTITMRIKTTELTRTEVGVSLRPAEAS